MSAGACVTYFAGTQLRYLNAYCAHWNMQLQDLKPLILEQCSDAIVQRVVVPCSGIDQPADSESTRSNSNVFRNGTGVLRFFF